MQYGFPTLIYKPVTKSQALTLPARQPGPALGTRCSLLQKDTEYPPNAGKGAGSCLFYRVINKLSTGSKYMIQSVKNTNPIVARPATARLALEALAGTSFPGTAYLHPGNKMTSKSLRDEWTAQKLHCIERVQLVIATGRVAP